MEPAPAVFERTHIVYDEKGEVLKPLHSSTSESRTEASAARESALVHSVLLAEGIHLDILDEEARDNEIPERFQTGSSKAMLKWFGAMCLAGIGMFLEAYIIITTGQSKTIWHDQYPECWSAEKAQTCPNLIRCCGIFTNNPHDLSNGECNLESVDKDFCTATGQHPSDMLCSGSVLNSISYSEFAGIMLGMLSFGVIADMLGRQKAGLLTAVFMIIGVTMMTFFDNTEREKHFFVFAIFFGLFGVGVGGEYPLTASTAASHHATTLTEAEMDDEELRRRRCILDHERTVRRGETIAVVFSMQGVGAVVGSAFLLTLIYFSGQLDANCEASHTGNNSSGFDKTSLNVVWRSFYFIGVIFVAMVLIYRGLITEEGDGHSKLLERKRRREAKLGERTSVWKILGFYGPRLFGTGGSWFVWDISFYGLKLFSGPIFNAINPDGNLVVTNGYLLINNLCALAGYYCAARVLDIRVIGRRRLQLFSFVMCAVLFSLTAATWNSSSPQAKMLLFFLSSYFGNFGANVTTYVMAAETYPTELRATCHGLSAFMGKVGALLGTITFGYLGTVEIFYTCAVASVIGVLFTFIFSVDLTRVSLAEHDAQLELFLEGRLDAYKGKLNDKNHLSNYEIWTGRHGDYDPHWASKLIGNEKATASQHSKVVDVELVTGMEKKAAEQPVERPLHSELIKD